MSTTVETAVTTVVDAPYAAHPARRSQHRARRALAVTGVVVVVVAGAAYWLGLPARLLGRAVAEESLYTVKAVTLNITLKEDGELKPVNSEDIKCEVQGQGVTIEWIIDESTRVKKGDLLVKLAADDLKERVTMEEMEVGKIRTALENAKQALAITISENESTLEKARVRLEVAELELKRYMEGEYEKTKMAIEIAIEKTDMDIKQKKEELKKSRPLEEKGFVTRSKIEEIESTIKQLEMTLKKHELEITILDDYEKPKNEKQKASDVKQAREEQEREKQRTDSRKLQAEARVKDQQDTLGIRTERYERLKEQYAKCEIHAPIDGVVRYGGSRRRWGGGNRVAPGERAYPGQTLMTIPDTSQMMVSTRIHEADRHQISEGLECLVRVPAVPGHTFAGKLSKIAQFADSQRGWLNPDLKEHATEILLDETDADISPGDTAHVEIMIEEVPDVLAIPVQAVFSRGPKRFVFVRHPGSTEPVEVKLGRSSMTLIEVVEGLEEGDRVLMHVDERLLAKLPAASTVQPERPTPKRSQAEHDATATEADEETSPPAAAKEAPESNAG